MQAVVRTGGKQYRVEEGAIVAVDRLQGEPGTRITLGDVLLAADGEKVGPGSGVTVTAEIVSHDKGAKIEVLKYKNKTRYRKHTGHRSQATKIKILKIGA